MRPKFGENASRAGRGDLGSRGGGSTLVKAVFRSVIRLRSLRYRVRGQARWGKNAQRKRQGPKVVELSGRLSCWHGAQLDRLGIAGMNCLDGSKPEVCRAYERLHSS